MKKSRQLPSYLHQLHWPCLFLRRRSAGSFTQALCWVTCLGQADGKVLKAAAFSRCLEKPSCPQQPLEKGAGVMPLVYPILCISLPKFPQEPAEGSVKAAGSEGRCCPPARTVIAASHLQALLLLPFLLWLPQPLHLSLNSAKYSSLGESLKGDQATAENTRVKAVPHSHEFSSIL